jgi:subtilisin family serine protease
LAVALSLLVATACSASGGQAVDLHAGVPGLRVAVAAGRVAPALVEQLREHGSADGIVTFRSAEDLAATLLGAEPGEVGAGLEELRARYQAVESRLLTALGDAATVLESFPYLPVALVRFTSEQALALAGAAPVVEGVSAPASGVALTKESIPLVHADRTRAAGDRGEGTVVAILDTGVDYRRAAFGRCTAPAQPATCAVVEARDFAAGDGALDDNGHGTNVAGIVRAVAPGAKILAFDVFDEVQWTEPAIDAAIDEVMRRKAEGLNIVAMNMSLGVQLSASTTTCTEGLEGGPNAFAALFAQARAAGIMPVVAAGNDAPLADGIGFPACSKGAISVGAVYDANSGLQPGNWCLDPTSRADAITCFSQRGPNLTLFAPGAVIDAAGIEESGTSQASPHVAGAVAVLAGARPGVAASEVEAALASTGPLVQGGGGKHRLDVEAAVARIRALEAVPPVASVPEVVLGTPEPGSATVPATVTWTGADVDGTGVVAFDLVMRTDGPPWVRVPLETVSATSVTLALDPGQVYRFAVRAHDAAGNVGAWARGPDVTVG